MDEPFAGIDATTEQSIAQIFSELKAQGKTVVCVHHDLRTVPQYYDWVVLLNVRLVAAGPVESVFTSEYLDKTYGGRLGALAEVTEKLRQAGWEGRK